MFFLKSKQKKEELKKLQRSKEEEKNKQEQLRLKNECFDALKNENIECLHGKGIKLVGNKEPIILKLSDNFISIDPNIIIPFNQVIRAGLSKRGSYSRWSEPYEVISIFYLNCKGKESCIEVHISKYINIHYDFYSVKAPDIVDYINAKVKKEQDLLNQAFPHQKLSLNNTNLESSSISNSKLFVIHRLTDVFQKVSYQKSMSASESSFKNTKIKAERPTFLFVADEIRKLSDLLKEGLISEEEFERQKTKLLS